MQVAVFEQASAYAPYGGPIQIQSNALRALQRINPTIYEELCKVMRWIGMERNGTERRELVLFVGSFVPRTCKARAAVGLFVCWSVGSFVRFARL